MPVTAKLSRAFYDKFGDEATNELVNWLNAVDDTYRTDLRELNEVNFARFDAKLEQRLAESDANWTERWTALDSKLELGLAKVRNDLITWMFGLWATTMLGLAGLYLRS